LNLNVVAALHVYFLALHAVAGIGIFGEHPSVLVRLMLCTVLYVVLVPVIAASSAALKWVIVGAWKDSSAVQMDGWGRMIVTSIVVLVDELLMSGVRGTPLYAAWLYLLGVRLGSLNVCWLSGPPPEADLLELGADVVVNEGVDFFTHNIEGGRLNLSRVRVGSGATIGEHAGLLGPLEIGEGAHIFPGAQVPKELDVPPSSQCSGNPASFFLPA